MNLVRDRCEFSIFLAKLILWVNEQQDARGPWQMNFDEVKVHNPRPVWIKGERLAVADANHKHGSLHYQGLAADLNLYIAGKWISDGGDPAWTAIGSKWEGMSPSCTWGGRWRGDSNHVSWREGQPATPEQV